MTPDGDYTTVALTVRDIYEKLASQEVPYLRLHNQILGYSRYITLKDIVKKQDNFRKKYLIVYYDDFSRIMYSDDYRAVDDTAADSKQVRAGTALTLGQTPCYLRSGKTCD